MKLFQALQDLQLKKECVTSFSCACFTSMKNNLDGRIETFRASQSFMNGGEWYDWCLVEYECDDDTENVFYPAQILAFVQFKYDFSWDEDADTDSLFSVIQSSESKVKMSDLQKNFVCKFDLGFDKEDC